MEVNQAEFARIVGVSKPYITKLVKTGKLKLNENRKLNLEESKKILSSSKNPSFDANREHAQKQKGVPLKERVEKAQSTKPLNEKEKDLIDDEDIKDLDSESMYKINILFNKARAAEKVALAKLRDIDVKIKKGELLEAEIVQREAAEVGNLITQKLYNMVYKLAPLLVGIETQKQAKDILESEVEIVLEELNRMSNEL
jgi:phage terminase Nu1 subunit (DNA packaging protein)